MAGSSSAGVGEGDGDGEEVVEGDGLGDTLGEGVGAAAGWLGLQAEASQTSSTPAKAIRCGCVNLVFFKRRDASFR